MSTKKTRREAPAVNAGSMADIAFLLLIFFLVTTTIAEDKGVLVRLPEWSSEPPKTALNQDDVLTVTVNKLNNLLVEDEEVALSQVPGLLEMHLSQPNAQPGKRIVSLTHDRGTSYRRYLEVYDALKLGYHQLWDEYALDRFQVTYDLLDKTQQRRVRDRIPMVISEAEPTEIL